jgi:hypothetical protein
MKKEEVSYPQGIIKKLEEIYKKVSQCKLNNDTDTFTLKHMFKLATPKKPFEMTLGSSGVYFCNYCKHDLDRKYYHCPRCSQSIDWTDIE